MEQPEWGRSVAKYFIVPQRVVLAIMCCFAISVGYALRICISVAIVVMVVKKESDHSNAACPPDPGTKGDDNQKGGEYDWSEERQGLILSAFYWGYAITNIPGGMIADKFGGKWILASGSLLSCLCSIASPLAVRQGGSLGLIAVRILMGAAQGVVYPSVSVLLSRWVPKKERGTLGAFTLGGGQLGIVAGNGLSGILLDAFEWDFTFYFFGFLGLIWVLIFVGLRNLKGQNNRDKFSPNRLPPHDRY